MRIRHGFTLIELIVVVSLIGLVSTAVAVRWSGVTNKAQLQTAIERFQAADGRLRDYCRRHDKRAELEIALGSHRFIGKTGNSKERERAWSLGRNFQIRRIVTKTRKTSTGTATIDISPSGQSKSYAVEMAGPHITGAWLLCTGLTGQWTEMESETDVERIFAAIE